jgi:AmmeMemoRadiSam system protein B
MATPLGEVPVHAAAAAAFLEACPIARPDDRPHKAEHSLEVQLPFLQAVRGDKPLSVLPVLLATHEAAALKEVAAALVAALEREAPGALLVASSDMSHYRPEAEARSRDREAIREMERLDPEALQEVCIREGVSMCGVSAAMVAMEACKMRGASEARLLRYATSAEAGGDPQEVVGYAGLLIH